MGWPSTSYRLTGGTTNAADRRSTRLLRGRSIGGSVYRGIWVTLKVSVNLTKGGRLMRIGSSLALIAIGAILKFAVTTSVSGISVSTVGVVLMVVGVAGLVISVIMANTARRTDVVHHTAVGDGSETLRHEDLRV